ncbi:MAG: packaged DNA stabilization gp4 family protein [Gammaproteobacteria bacterium]
METAESVINDILQEILVQASEQPIEAVDFQFVRRYMNRYMSELAITNPLGYTAVTLPTDLITIADGAINGLIYNVALNVVTSFDIAPAGSLVANAQRSLKVIRKISRNLVSTKHPSTLPIGAGNECWGNNTHFYNGVEDSLLTEQNGNILLEDTTNE